MRKRTKITIDPKYILIIIVAACVVLMVVSFKFRDKMEPVRSVAGNIITPMQNGINRVGTKIAEQLDYITFMLTASPSSEPLSIINVLYQLSLPLLITRAATLG